MKAVESLKLFKEYIKSKEFRMDEEKNQGFIVLSTTLNVSQDIEIHLTVVFDDDLIFVSGYNNMVFSPIHRKLLLSKINDLNNEHTFVKFKLDEDNNVSLGSYLITKNVFSPDDVYFHLNYVFMTFEDEYKGFLNILYG